MSQILKRKLILLAPFVVLVGCGYWVGWHHLLQHVSYPQSAAPHGTITTALLVAMWNYMGWDNASTVAQEVENPRRNYPLAMLATCGIVALSYILPLSAIAAAGIPVDQFMMPSALTRRNRRRSAWVAILLCGLGWALALGFTYERLISIDLILDGASLVLVAIQSMTASS
jgi:amino acid transporter